MTLRVPVMVPHHEVLCSPILGFPFGTHRNAFSKLHSIAFSQTRLVRVARLRHLAELSIHQCRNSQLVFSSQMRSMTARIGKIDPFVACALPMPFSSSDEN